MRSSGGCQPFDVEFIVAGSAWTPAIDLDEGRGL